jgi:UDP-N-acetylglucosamine/UDP-N-acetylgalactosamine diphosphorylase
MADTGELRQRLREHGQEHVLAFWERLTEEQRAGLAAQIESLDFGQIAALQALLPGRAAATAPAVTAAAFEPADPLEAPAAERAAWRERGAAALRAGQVGVILVAGGQGSRLGFEGPKGTFPLGPISNATLFEIHARKILALQRAHGAVVPFYVMTSTVNDADTRRFFEQHAYFGLTPNAVRFFVQGMYPALFPHGRIVLESPAQLALAPDGHGGLLAAMARTGVLADLKRRGLTTLFYFQVDNPLVEIADPEFLGAHLERAAEMSLKVCTKRDPAEGLGVIVQREGRLAIVEYTELTPAQKEARRPDGRLRYLWGSVAIHVFAREFLERMATAGLPLHLAHKKVTHCDEHGRPFKPATPNAYKFEKFIFDALPAARRAVALAFDRAEEFAPVKNASGEDSPDTARAAMLEKSARRLAAAGRPLPRRPDGALAVRVELDPCFAGGAEELARKLAPRGPLTGDTLLR